MLSENKKFKTLSYVLNINLKWIFVFNYTLKCK